MNKFNEDKTRCATDEYSAFGIALYEGHAEGSNFVGTLWGNVSNPEDAERWLRGEPIGGQMVKAGPDGRILRERS